MPRPGPVTLALILGIALVALAASLDVAAALLRPLAPHLAWLFP